MDRVGLKFVLPELREPFVWGVALFQVLRYFGDDRLYSLYIPVLQVFKESIDIILPVFPTNKLT